MICAVVLALLAADDEPAAQPSFATDAGFAVDQLVEVAVRALSPGINDPFTAVACLDRLYPRFREADHPDWHKVIDRARKGDGDALEVVGHKGDPDQHPVCATILGFVGSGKEGTKVRKEFAGPKCGWPQDAIDAALICSHSETRSPGEFSAGVDCSTSAVRPARAAYRS